MKELVRDHVLGLRVGELVEVRSEDEIWPLDERGELEGRRSCPRCCSSVAGGSGWRSGR